MNPKNPSAFPINILNYTGDIISQEYGMTLRDYFANSAMEGMIIKYGKPDDYNWGRGTQDTHDEFAKRCYKISDAMLKAREL